MRQDMKKVVVERPRLYRYKKIHKHRDEQHIKENLEDAPTKEPLRNRRERTKQFNEHLQPLYKYLHKQIGRPWDKVHSEVVQTLGGGKGTLQDHVLQHVDRYVEKEVVMMDGIPYSIRTFGQGLIPLTSNRSYRPLYVHPVTGLLRIAKPPRVKKERFEVYRLERHKAVLVYKDTWYLATLKRVPDATYDPVSKMTVFPKVRDAWLGREIAYPAQLKDLWGEWKNIVGVYYYAESIRTMKKSEVKALPITLRV